MLIIITDMDGTLLDEHYSYDAALPALGMLRDLGIPLIFCTSKTRAEVEIFREQIGVLHPFIVENGGALYVPENYFPQEIQSPVRRDGYAVIEIGSPYWELVETLREASTVSGCEVRGFHQMSAEEISRRYNLPLRAADAAKRREYDEPFEILSGDERRLLSAIEERKKRWTQGGRFYHIIGANDKAHCVNLLCHFFVRAYEDVTVVGLGDGLNDTAFLKSVHVPIVLDSPAAPALKKAVPHSRLFPGGPKGWNEAVLDVIGRLDSAGDPSVSPAFSKGR